MIAPDTNPGQPDGNGHDPAAGDGNGGLHGDLHDIATAVRRRNSRLPEPRVQKAHWAAWLIWLVPAAVAVGAGFYFTRIYHERGPEIVVRFADATGLKVGETPLVVHGVKVGSVDEVDLDPDNVHALVHVQLQRGCANIANAGTVFYMNRPDVSGGNLMGLGTIVSGPYLTAIVGRGDPATVFTGSEGPPNMRGAGMRVIVHAPRVDHLAPDAPVYYRGTQVGLVQDIRLSNDSTGVNVTAFIWLRYAPLLRTNSVFWPLSTAQVKGGLFEGIQVQLATLRTLLGGGIAFATPDDGRGRLAQDGTNYDLSVDGPKPEWLAWTPRIPLGPDPLADIESGHGAQQEQGVLQSTLRVR